MDYLKWTLVALAGYSLVAPLMKVATAEIPPSLAAMVTNGMLVVGTVAVVVYTGTPVVPNLATPRIAYVIAAGACLTVGILAYYQALAAGPVSVVTPVFGLFLVVSALFGVLFLGEDVTLRKAAGIGCAVLAVYLTAGPRA